MYAPGRLTRRCSATVWKFVTASVSMRASSPASSSRTHAVRYAGVIMPVPGRSAPPAVSLLRLMPSRRLRPSRPDKLKINRTCSRTYAAICPIATLLLAAAERFAGTCQSDMPVLIGSISIT